MSLQGQINAARFAMGQPLTEFGQLRTAGSDEAVPAGFLKRLKDVPAAGDGPEEKVVNSLKSAMDAIMGANEIVHRTRGQLTKRDAPKLRNFATALEGAAVDIMSAAKKLP